MKEPSVKSSWWIFFPACLDGFRLPAAERWMSSRWKRFETSAFCWHAPAALLMQTHLQLSGKKLSLHQNAKRIKQESEHRLKTAAIATAAVLTWHHRGGRRGHKAQQSSGLMPLHHTTAVNLCSNLWESTERYITSHSEIQDSVWFYGRVLLKSSTSVRK